MHPSPFSEKKCHTRSRDGMGARTQTQKRRTRGCGRKKGYEHFAHTDSCAGSTGGVHVNRKKKKGKGEGLHASATRTQVSGVIIHALEPGFGAL